MLRQSLSDYGWNIITELMPKNGKRGNQWRDHRTIIRGILWILRTGAPWRDLPEIFGPWKTVYERFRRWSRNGFWDEIIDKLQSKANSLKEIDWHLFCIDGTSIRAHKAAAGAGKSSTKDEPSDHSLGRSRGGFGTKIHLICDSVGLPIVVKISPGETHELTCCLSLVDSIRIPSIGKHRRRRPDMLAGDKGYTSHFIRGSLKKRRIKPLIPTRTNEPKDPSFDRKSYHRRNIIERCIGWLKENRRIATRYEKLAVNYLAMLKIGVMLRYFKKFESWAAHL